MTRRRAATAAARAQRELQEYNFAFFAHELGNVASPVALLAAAAATRPETMSRQRTIDTLGRIATRIHELTLLSRLMQGGTVGQQLAPVARMELADAAALLHRRLEDLLPTSCAFTITAPPGASGPGAAEHAAHLLPVLCCLVRHGIPDRVDVSLCLIMTTNTDCVLSMRVVAQGARVSDAWHEGRRWAWLLEEELLVRGATMSRVDGASGLDLECRVPLQSEGHPDPEP